MATLGSVFLGFNCPDRGHRVQGGPAGRRTRSATLPLDPAATHLLLAPTRRTGQGRRIRQQLPATGHFIRTGYDYSSSQ